MEIYPTGEKMNERMPGIYLYKKQDEKAVALKDMLQFLRSHNTKGAHSFSYIEARSSLHPHLSLWENLQLEVGHNSLDEFKRELKPEWTALINLIRGPHELASNCAPWECFIISLLKGLILPSQNLLIDIQEDLLSPFMIQQFKKAVLMATKDKVVYLASAHTSLWLDCAHTLVDRKQFLFVSENLDYENLRLKWAL